MKLFKDTLSHNGKWSRKSLTAFTSLMAALFYAFIYPLLWVIVSDEPFEFHETIFITLCGMSGSTLYMTVQDKKNNKQTKEDDFI